MKIKPEMKHSYWVRSSSIAWSLRMKTGVSQNVEDNVRYTQKVPADTPRSALHKSLCDVLSKYRCPGEEYIGGTYCWMWSEKPQPAVKLRQYYSPTTT